MVAMAAPLREAATPSWCRTEDSPGRGSERLNETNLEVMKGQGAIRRRVCDMAAFPGATGW